MELNNVETKILAVCNELSILTELESVLKKTFPFTEIVKETDPLMACKYSFNNEVNYVFAAETMKRMSGSDLLQFIKKEYPAVKTYLFFCDSTCPTETFYDDFDGVIELPFSVEKLEKVIKGNEDSANS